MHGSACNGGFGRRASKKAGMRAKKACEANYYYFLTNFKTNFKFFEFVLFNSFLCIVSSKKVIYFHHKIL